MIVGTFNPGSGRQETIYKSTIATFESKDDDLYREGMRIQDMARTERPGSVVGVGGGNSPVAAWAVVWRPGSGTQWWKSGMDADEFKDEDTKHFGNGLYLQALDIVDDEYAGCWRPRPGGGAQFWHSGLDHDEFKDEDQRMYDRGLRLSQLVVDHRSQAFAGVWHPGEGAQFWRSGMDIDEFKSESKKFFDQGLRIWDLANNGFGGYAAVWRPGSGGQFWESRSEDNIPKFVKANDDYVAKGYRLDRVAVAH